MDRYAVIGHPVAHSLSPRIHRLFAAQTEQALVYDTLPAPRTGFAPVAGAFFADGGKGLNVTVPFKAIAARWVHRRDASAQSAGVVNTINVESGHLVGYNSDGIGLATDLVTNHGFELAGKRLLVIGAGGAVNGVVRPLLELAPARMVIANRTIATARALVNELREAYVGVELEWCALADAAGPYDLVINGTSAGLGGLGALVAPSAARGAVCYDLLYSAAPDSATPFCAWARECGADSVVDGLGMLVEQAAQAFYIWRGVWPATLPVLDQLRGVTSLDA